MPIKEEKNFMKLYQEKNLKELFNSHWKKQIDYKFVFILIKDTHPNLKE